MGIHERWDRAKALTLPISNRIHLQPVKDKLAKFRAMPGTAYERAKKGMDEDFARIVARWRK